MWHSPRLNRTPCARVPRASLQVGGANKLVTEFNEAPSLTKGALAAAGVAGAGIFLFSQAELLFEVGRLPALYGRPRHGWLSLHRGLGQGAGRRLLERPAHCWCVDAPFSRRLPVSSPPASSF